MATYNKNNSAVKRIMQEAKELSKDPSTDYSASPLEDNLFDWHCTLRGPPGTEFEGGLYHFRIVLPAEYPFKAPSLMMLTPSGRFEVNTKICISFTNYHEELWQPAWGVRTAIIGLQGFFPLKGTAAVGVGSLEAPASERRRLAKLSREWICPHCNLSNLECLPDPPAPSESSSEASGNLEPNNGSAAEDVAQKASQAENTAANSPQTSSADTRVDESLQSADTQAQLPNGPSSSSAPAVPSDSQQREQRIFVGLPGSSETRRQQQQQQEIEKNDRSGQGGASTYDESPFRRTDDDSSPLEARATSEVVEPSGSSSSSAHSLSTSLSQARSREEVGKDESGVVRQRVAISGGMNSNANANSNSGAMRQDDHHALGSAVTHTTPSSSSPSRRSLILLDGAIVMLLVWAGALVTRKFF